MGSRIPQISKEHFCQQLMAAVQEQLVYSRFKPSCMESSEWRFDDGFENRCFEHYSELQRWNPRVSLIGPGTSAELIQRHYAESLAALPAIEMSVGDGAARCPPVETLVDLGSGGGFPGLVLAAARQRLQVFLVEPREKKWNFLRAVVRRSGLSCLCLDGRLGDRQDGSALPKGLPERIDVVTCRALALSALQFERIQEHSPAVRFFLWQGEGLPELPGSLRIRQEVLLVGSKKRRILEIVPV